jgi:hypothetical protein
MESLRQTSDKDHNPDDSHTPDDNHRLDDSKKHGASDIYSQVSNFGNFMKRSVDPRTGQYTYFFDLYETPASARNLPPFKLTLSHDPLDVEDHGYGKGWNINLSSIVENSSGRKTLRLSNGEKYSITASGLLEDQKLKDFKWDEQAWRRSPPRGIVHYKSGVTEEIGDHYSGMTTRITSPSGRSLIFTHSQGRLVKISDNDTELVRFTSSPGSLEVSYMDITSPTTIRLFISRATNWLTSIQLYGQDIGQGTLGWRIDYGQFNLITQVSSPGGLVEIISYNYSGHETPDWAPISHVPYVDALELQPGWGQPTIVTNYSYSSNNFFGYGSGIGWNESRDVIYDAPNSYRYSSMACVVGGPSTTHIYNKFHLLVEFEEQQGSNKFTQIIKYWADVG